jgi:hypothetical protein
MGATSSLVQVQTQRDKELEKIVKLPPEIAQVKLRRLENKDAKEKFNREAALYKFQHRFDEYTNNPLDHLLGIGKKAPPQQDEEPQSWFMRKKLREIEEHDPNKELVRRTETAEDQSKHIVRMIYDFAKGDCTTRHPFGHDPSPLLPRCATRGLLCKLESLLA